MKLYGLTDEEVLLQRSKYGSNKINKIKSNTLLRMFIESLGDPIIKILLTALCIKIVFLFESFDWFETIGILIAIFIATFVSTISEYGSEKAFESLQNKESNFKIKVIRNNKYYMIDSDEVVVKDIIVLSSGDMIPADGKMIKGKIFVDESMINGETKEKEKNINDIVLRGTVVYNEEGIFEVTAVGDKTVYGKLANELQERNPISPLKLRLKKLAKIISKIGYIGSILVSTSYLFSVIVIDNNFDWNSIINTLTNFNVMFNYIIYALTLSVTIIVVAVPEGLPMMITLVLSSNMKRMLKSNVLVRKMVGIETSGSLNVLLTDKTGTLTKGKLEVSSFISGDFKEYKNVKDLEKNIKLYNLLQTSLYYNNSSVYDEALNIIGGNSTDKALLKYIKMPINNKINIKHTQYFDSTLKYSYVISQEDNIYIKGAGEKIIPYCNHYFDSFGRKQLIDKKAVYSLIEKKMKKGFRIIAVAEGETPYIKDLTLIGIILIKDEIRDEARVGIDLVTNAGIQTIMVTGDSLETAKSIATDVGLLKENDIILTSETFNKKTDYEIKSEFSKLKILARALPDDKSRLVRLAQELDLVVGMTGDGVNDAPALKKADVGYAMGSGTEVAKEASDIVILDDNIMSISASILYGRTIFKSIRKFIILQLTINLCALLLSIVGPFVGINTPITIIQMLWINMIMDTLAGVAFSYEPALKEYMKEKPKKKSESIINKYMYSEILFTGIYSAILCLVFLKSNIIYKLIRFDVDSKYLMTAYFSLFIFISIFNAFNARTHRLNIFANIFKNKIFICIMTFILIIQIYLIYKGGSLFRTYGLNIKEMVLVIGLSSTVIIIDFIRKIILKRFNKLSGV